MTRWIPNLYRQEGIQRGIPETIIESSIQQANALQTAGLPAVLTLGHLAFHTDIPYSFLRNTVARKINPYRTFSIKKHSGGHRYINAPFQNLLKVQQWIDRFVLSKIPVSHYSYAFGQGQSIVVCAQQHLGCNWLVKIDLRHFFESLSEIQAYHVFCKAGYDHLISFEMARICTKVLPISSRKYNKSNWLSTKLSPIMAYNDKRIGYLPQGAPTSPKLSNAIVFNLDLEIAEAVEKLGLTFTRYADDIVLSTASKDFTREKGLHVIHTIYSILPKYGLRPNPQKAQIVPPGARKIVLGLLVDSSKVRLSRSFKNKLECHLHFSVKDPVGHAQKRGFHSVIGLKNYVMGLLAYARQVDPEYTEKLFKQIGIPEWPI
jgi:RNA-directed DNA polymerase